MLSKFSKIFEKLVCKRRKQFIKKNAILHKHEYGFQEEKLTDHAIFNVYRSINDLVETKNKFSCIFLDFVNLS